MAYTKQHDPWVQDVTVIDAVDMNGIETGIATAHTLAAAAQSTADDAEAAASRPYQFRVSTYGAVGDGKVVADVVATNGSAVITSATAAWTSGDVGKAIMLNGGLDIAGGPLVGTIASYQSATQVTLSTAAGRTGTGLAAVWGTDDTAEIKAASDAAAAYALANQYYAEVLFDDRIYMLASGPTQTTSPAVYNTQIPVAHPAVNGTSRKLVLAFKGSGPADHAHYWKSTAPNLAGTSLVSTVLAPNTVDATYGVQSVIGGPSGGGAFTGGWANVKVSVTDLQVICGAYTNLTGMDFTWLAAAHVNRSAAHVFAPPVDGPEPVLNSMPGQAFFQSRKGVGLRMPASGNNADNTMPSFATEGFTLGLKVTDHATIGRLLTVYNDLAVLVDSTEGLGVHHNITIANWAAEVYNGGIKIDGGYVQLSIVMASECISPAYDIRDDANSAHGEIWWSDPADSRNPTVTGGANLTFHNNKKATVQYGGALYERVITLTDAATIATDASLGNVFKVTLGGNRTLGAPTNPVDGQLIRYQVKQDGTGSRTLTYNAVFDSTGVPTLKTAASSVDILQFVYESGANKWVYVR